MLFGMDTAREILQFLHHNPSSLRQEIGDGVGFEGSDATLKRLIASLVKAGDVVVEGKARATRYRLSNQAHLLMPLNIDTYFSLDVDERKVQQTFNFSLLREQLPEVQLFSAEEHRHLEYLQSVFRQHVGEMSANEYSKEMERLGIDLSWKSSQIEGNTYSLLETERLLFSDGNKRTARITSNALLIAHGYCPLSFRTVDSIDYKKAMLIFYEQNNLYAFKQIFMQQYEYAVKEYF